MARLFRKGRFNFFKGKGFAQYLLYIVLEMVLVIAGILIALEINNGNENRKKEEKAISILHEVRRDLRRNLIDIQNLTLTLEAKDSLISRVMLDSVSEQDYRSNFAYAGLIMTYMSMNFQDNGFNSMARQSEFFSRDYDTLFTNLEGLYEDQYGIVETMQERLGDHVINTLERWSLDKPWFHLLSRGQATDEAIAFFTEDPFYLNAVDIYRTYAIVNMLPALREAKLRTVKAIIAISEKLEPMEDAYLEFEDYLIATDFKHWAADTGTYDLAGIIEFEVAIEEGGITMAQSGQPAFQVHPRNDSTLFLPGGDLSIIFNREEGIMTITGGLRPQTLKKVDP